MKKQRRLISELSASNAETWNNCTAYYGLAVEMEERNMVFEEEKKEANEGTIAHLVFAKLARKVFNCNTIPPLTSDLFEDIQVEGSDQLMKDNALSSIKDLISSLIREDLVKEKDGIMKLATFSVLIERKLDIFDPSFETSPPRNLPRWTGRDYEYRPRATLPQANGRTVRQPIVGGLPFDLGSISPISGESDHRNDATLSERRYQQAQGYVGNLADHLEAHHMSMAEVFPEFNDFVANKRIEPEIKKPPLKLPKICGTSDLILIFPSKKRVIVVDYKYGENLAVTAIGNLQLKLYTLGVFNYLLGQPSVLSPDNFVFVNYILQPRMNVVSRDRHTSTDIKRFRASIREKVQEIMDGGTFKTGDHCQFCKAKAGCPKWGNELAPAFNTMVGANRLSREQSIQIAINKNQLINFIEAVYENVVNAKKANSDTFPELEFTLIRQGNRVWRKDIEPDDIAKNLQQAGIADPYKRSLIGITEAEKLAGKGKLDEMTERGYGVYKLEKVKNILKQEFDKNEREIEI